MANSKLTFYRTNLIPSSNMVIDNIEKFLQIKATVTYTADDFQYIRPDAEIDIKVEQEQDELVDNDNPDFLLIEQSGFKWYYYIMSAEQVSTKAIKYHCVIDVLNTFRGKYTLTDRSRIEREHVDRFTRRASENTDTSATVAYTFNKDRADEGLAPKLYLKSDVTVSGTTGPLDDKVWYLIYRTSDNGTDKGKPCIDLVANENIVLERGEGGLPEGITRHEREWFSVDIAYRFFELNQTITYVVALDDWTATITTSVPGRVPAKTVSGGTLVMRYQAKSGDKPNSVNIDYIAPNGDVQQIGPWFQYTDPYSGYDFYGGVANILLESVTGKYLLYENTNAFNLQTMLADVQNWDKKLWIIGSGNALGKLSEIDRTDSTIVKIIECPYCPIVFTQDVTGNYHWPSQWTFTGVNGTSVLRTLKLDQEFIREKIWTVGINKYLNGQTTFYKSSLDSTTTEHLVDPKIYNSATYRDALVYDSNEYDIPIEDLMYTYSGNKIIDMNVDYCQSNALTSDLGFTINPSEDSVKLNTQQTFGYALLSNRNNEVPIFTSDYLNYMKNGYNYDKEKKERQMQQNTANMIMSAASAAATAAIAGAIKGSTAGWVGAAVGGAIGLIGGAITASISNQQAEADIQQKINENAAKAFNISGSNDRSLFDWYSGNKLHHMVFEPTEDVKKMVQTYYERYGYARNVFESPNVNSRYFYNYVRGDVVLKPVDENYQPYYKFKDLIRQRYSEGVYFIHNRITTEYTWDTDLALNNVETSLLPTVWSYNTEGYNPFDSASIQNIMFDDLFKQVGFDYEGDSRTLDNKRYYAECEIYLSGIPLGRPDYRGNTRDQFREYQPGSHVTFNRITGTTQSFSGALIMIRLVDGEDPRNTSKWSIYTVL